MPMAIRVVSREKYDEWLAEAKKKFAAAELPTRLASSEPAR
jgi:cytochrome c oxidase subunit 2